MDTTMQRSSEDHGKDQSVPFACEVWTDESAVTAIEYGLLASLIAVVIVGAVSATGDSLLALYEYWSSVVIAALGG